MPGSFVDDDYRLNGQMTRRAALLGLGAGAASLVLLSRLYWLQVIEGHKYRTLADKNRINIKILPPVRGIIQDRFGVPIADNTRNYRVMIVPEQTESFSDTIRRLEDLLGLRDAEIKALIKEAKRSPDFVPLEVRDYLTWEQVARVEVNLPDLPGVFIDEGSARLYPFAQATAHLVGYVGSPTKDDVQKEPLFKLPGFKIGKSGLERELEDRLRGHAGSERIEVNVVGREVRKLERQKSKPGNTITLSIDAELQQQAQDRLSRERSACAVIMDVHTGDVLALASYPSFDPNQFSRQLTTGLWQEVLNDPAHPLTNKAVAGQYPPGSTFKMVTALAGLEAGVIDEHKTVFCPGHYMQGDMKFHCWKPEGHGTMNVVTALEQSCDVFFYDMANKVGIERIARMARRLGFGDLTGIELPEEQKGLIPDKSWKRRRGLGAWLPGDTINASIGQGDILTTPLQLAVMTARLVNGGYAVTPRLLPAGSDKKGPDFESLDLNKDHLKLVMDGMNRVTQSQMGTAYGSRLTFDPSVQMGGKTGTAQVQRITLAQRAAGVKNEDLDWTSRHHALFVGYAPSDHPRFAVSVVVEHGIGGARTAAPLARDLMTLALKRHYVPSDISVPAPQKEEKEG